MAKNDNLTDFLTDVADAIREKKGTTDKINPQEFSNEIKGIRTSFWTGHVDVEGLKAIGWDDEDIAYYQEHGVNWMEEDDEFHKVPEDNKALYGVINYSNYKDYKDIIVYLPKFDMSGDYGYDTFNGFTKMVGMPNVNINISQMYRTFYECYMLSCIPPLDMSNASRMFRAFCSCRSLMSLPPIIVNNSSDCRMCFSSCYNLTKIILRMNTGEQAYEIIRDCVSLRYVEILGMSRIVDNIAGSNFSLMIIKVDGLAANQELISASCLKKESVLYMIEHEAATSAITITLHKDAYARLAEDPDIVAALSNHPLVSLASA